MKTMIFAHRGVPTILPENSIAGFKYCLEHHADAIEFDVHLTSDNVPVVIHDDKIDRTTNGTGWVHAFSLNELTQFHLTNGELIPTLASFLKLIGDHDIHLNLEFKTNKVAMPGIERIVLNQVAAAHLKYPVIYSSFNLATLQRAYQIDAYQSYNLLYKLPRFRPKHLMKKYHLAGVHPHFYAWGVKANERLWTIDAPTKQARLFQRGVSGIFTNRFEAAQRLRDSIQGETIKL